MLIEKQPKTKNNLNVFRRRTALNVNSNTLSQIKSKAEKEKFKKIQNNKQIDQQNQFLSKFKQPLAKRKDTKDQIKKQLNERKKQRNFEKILEGIEQRGGSFYRFGFKSHQKSTKKLFAEVLNVVPSKMKGTMHIGEMWPASQTAKFMKQNKIFINKLKLMDKLRQIKTMQQKELIESTTSLYQFGVSVNSINSKYVYGHSNTSTRISSKQIANNNNTFMEFNRSMDQINSKLRKIKLFCSTERNLGKLRQMEDCLQKMNFIDYSYHQQIAEWV